MPGGVRENLDDLYNVVLPRPIAPVRFFLPTPRLGISLVVSRCLLQYKKVHRERLPALENVRLAMESFS
jgi:hypothetical protein